VLSYFSIRYCKIEHLSAVEYAHPNFKGGISKMFCRFCGTTLSADSTFCQSCGKPLTSSATSAGAPGAATAAAPAPLPAPVLKEKSDGVKKAILLGILLTLGLVWWFVSQQSTANNRFGPQQTRPFIPSTQPRVLPLIDTAFTLNAAQGHYWNFSVPSNATDIRVEGTFNASGGTGNDVEVYLLNDDEFVNWQNHHAVSALYNSGRVTQGTLNAPLPSGGPYHLIFNNKFSLFSPKAVKASIRLHYIL
jgi:hypothetical protein